MLKIRLLSDIFNKACDAELIIDTDKGIIREPARNNTYLVDIGSKENLTAGSITREEYVSLANEIIEYEDFNLAAPGSIETSLGTMSYKTLAKTFIEICETLRATSALPESVDVSA